jgi:putative spermidine/putrescine transport system permease protein
LVEGRSLLPRSASPIERFSEGNILAARDRVLGLAYVTPLMLVLVPFFVAPILIVLATSFLQSDGFGGIIATPTLQNYVDIFTSNLTVNLYAETIKFTVLTWMFSLIIGFWVAYFLVFHVRDPLLAIGLFLLCTVPFWTSNIIRMISWIPLLGKEGLINMSLIRIGLISQPLEFLLFSSVSVVIAYVHQLTIFMIVPIFNSMARIDKRVVEAALDAGASCFDIMRMIILPLSKNGIALGSIFVVSIVMGDFFVIKVMSGGGSASVVGALYEDVGVLQYPSAAASAVVLTIVVTILMVAILRTVDVRKELAR